MIDPSSKKMFCRVDYLPLRTERPLHGMLLIHVPDESASGRELEGRAGGTFYASRALMQNGMLVEATLRGERLIAE